MKIDYSKKNKVSFLLSTMLLGAVSLSAVPLEIINTDDIVITDKNGSGLSKSSFGNQTLENKAKISSDYTTGNTNVNINAILIDSLQNSTSSSNKTIIYNNGTIDLKAINGEADLSLNGISIVDTDVYNDDMPTLKMIDLRIINNKDIKTSAKSNYMAETSGILAYGIGMGNEIKNNGNISTYAESSNDALAAGIKVGDSLGGSITNSGTIEATAKGDKISTAFGISAVSAENITFTNAGTISTNAESKDGEAVSVATEFWGFYDQYNTGADEYSLINSEYTNNGTIKAVANGKENSEAIGLVADQVIEDSRIINNGTISVTASGAGANAEAITFKDVINSKIVNTKTIEAFLINPSLENDDATGIYTDKFENSEIKNSGTIITNANSNLTSSGNLSKGINHREQINSTITNSGTIKATINNKLDKKGMAIQSDKIDTNSTIFNASIGKIYGNIVLVTDNSDVGNAKFVNKGFISLPYNANKNATFEGVSIRPNFANLENSGTIEIGAFKHSDNKIENTQILTKTATFEKGSKMQVDVVEGSKAFVKGDTLSEVVTATDKLTINDLTLNQTKLKDNSALLDFEYKQTGNQLDIVVSDVKKLSDIVDGNTGNNTNTANKKPIASFFDDLRNNQSSFPNMGTILSKLDALSADNQVAQALNSMIPTTAASVVNSSNTITSNIANIVSNRLGNLKSGLNSGDDLKVNNNRVWAKAFGSIGEQKDKDSISGFDIKSYGLGLGFDNEYKDGQVLGLATFYTNANIETNGVNHENDVDAYSVVAYGSNLLADDKTTIYYQGSHTWQKNDSKRAIFTGDVADSKFTSKTFALDLKVGHNIAINDSFSIEPNIGTTYRHISNPSYTENGAGALNIHSDKFTSSELLGNFGADFEYKINSDSKLTATIGAGYDFKNDNNIVTSSFAGAPGVSFDTNGIDNGRWQYQAGLGYDLNLDNKNNMNFSYKYQGEGSKYNNNVVSLDYIYKF